MGTTYLVSIVNKSDNNIGSANLQYSIDSLLNSFNNIFSTYDPESEISRINSDTSQKVFPVSLQFYNLVLKSKLLFEDTDGAFDITINPLMALWNFNTNFSPENIPAETDIRETLSIIGMNHISLSNQTIYKEFPQLQFDTNAIAKGRGVDVVANFLSSLGFQHFMVEIGGEVFVSGVNKNQKTWKIGIKHPEQFSPEITAVASLRNAGMATSGTYQKYFTFNGKNYAHILDPETGWPIEHDIVSATVIAETCARADAIATALMVLGFENALQWVEKRDGVECYLIRRDKDTGDYITGYSENFPLH